MNLKRCSASAAIERPMLQGNLLNFSTSHKRKFLPNTVVPMWKRYSLHFISILARYSLSYSLSKETSTSGSAISFLPPTQTYQYKLHPTPLCRTKAGIRGWCRCGTATWIQCLCRQLGLVCGSIWPAEGSREGRRETDVSGIMCSLSGKFRALCSKMCDTYTFQMTGCTKWTNDDSLLTKWGNVFPNQTFCFRDATWKVNQRFFSILFVLFILRHFFCFIYVCWR